MDAGIFPPIIPGLTEPSKGSDSMRLLSSLTAKRIKDRKKFDEMFDMFTQLFTPRQPTMESDGSGEQSLVDQVGRSTYQP